MSKVAWIIFIVSVLSNVGMQFSLKLAGKKLGKVEFATFFENFLSFITVPEILMALAFVILSTLAYFLVLTRVPLSVAGPASSLMYVFAFLIGHYYFNESFSTTNFIGLGLIVGGVILVSG